MTILRTGEPSRLPICTPYTPVNRLGVGLLYNPSLPDFIRSHLDLMDYVAVIPDIGQTDYGPDHSPRFVEIDPWVDYMDWLMKQIPLIAHNVGLSIGSGGIFDTEYIQQIAQWHERYHFLWHSDHLSFSRVNGINAHSLSTALAVPVPYDDEVLDMIVDRVNQVQHIVPLTFLLENNVYFINIPEQDMTEPEFLNRLSLRTGCGLLLDLHNVYANGRNHCFDPYSFIDQVDLNRVIEVHIAGGNELSGMYVDSHAGPCPKPVWELLEYVVQNAPNLCAVTFEFHESYYPVLESEGILAELTRARQIWSKYH